MLIPHSFHDKLMEKELQKQQDLGDKFDLDPAKLLKEKILNNILSIQMFVFGNTSEETSVKFYEDHILPNFKTVKCYFSENERDYLVAGCIYDKIKLTDTSKILS